VSLQEDGQKYCPLGGIGYSISKIAYYFNRAMLGRYLHIFDVLAVCRAENYKNKSIFIKNTARYIVKLKSLSR
jgi:hypothetical protein